MNLPNLAKSDHKSVRCTNAYIDMYLNIVLYSKHLFVYRVYITEYVFMCVFVCIERDIYIYSSKKDAPFIQLSRSQLL